MTKTFFSCETFTAGVLQRSDTGADVKFAGKAQLREGDSVVLRGAWTEDPKYGPQFSFDSYSYEVAVDDEGLIDFLVRSASFGGLGTARARALVRAADGSFEEKLKEAPEDLARRASVPLEVVLNAKEEWFKRVDQNRTMSALAVWGVTPAKSEALFKRFGPSVIGIVENNPYWLCRKVRGLGFRTIDGYARRAGFKKDHPTRVEEGFRYVLGDQRIEGHTWTDSRDLVDAAQKILTLENLEWEAEIAAAVSRLEQDARSANFFQARIECDEGSPFTAVSERSVMRAELAVRESLISQAERPGSLREGFTPLDAEKFEPTLNDDQALAVANALGRRVSVIAGGAGVGKTYVIGAIVNIANNLGLSTMLMAPTGKAAKRMEQAIGQPASTIHRALQTELVGAKDDGAVGEDEEKDAPVSSELIFRFQKNENDPLSARIIIVDEVSMVDIELAWSLLRAIDFTKTSLILVGDHNQLPPVGPGAMLRDLLNEQLISSVILNKVVRQAGILKQNVSTILHEGVVNGGAEAEGKQEPGTMISPWYVLTQRGDTQSVRRVIEFLFRERLANYQILDPVTKIPRPIDPVWDVQCLTPMHKTDIGTRELNVSLQRIHQAGLGVDVPPPKKATSRPIFFPGDKVIWTKNHRDLELMNGDQGLVLDRDPSTGALTVDFSDDPRVPNEDMLRELTRAQQAPLQLAYAMTVHKAQGSEYPVCVFICAKAHTIMHHRGLMYTAVSRSRQATIIVGDRWAMSNCARKVKMDERRSLCTLLSEGSPAGAFQLL